MVLRNKDKDWGFIQFRIHRARSLPTVHHINSEKKKSVLVGGAPATKPLGISTFSPDKSEGGGVIKGKS
jgi:hypothetical protein